MVCHAYLFNDIRVGYFNEEENRQEASRKIRRRSESIRQFSAGLNIRNKSKLCGGGGGGYVRERLTSLVFKSFVWRTKNNLLLSELASLILRKGLVSDNLN